MKLLVFDVETTGIPKFGREHPASADYQPRVSQFSGRLVSTNDNDDGEEIFPGLKQIREYSKFFQPDGWTDKNRKDCNYLCVKLQNGIDVPLLLNLGIAAGKILDVYVEMANEADCFVAANTVFDMKMMRIELVRAEREEKFYDKPYYCILDASTDIVAIPATPAMVRAERSKQKKKPSVGECYEHFFGEPLKNAHDASVDTLATCRILNELIKLGKGPTIKETAITDHGKEKPESPSRSKDGATADE